jgi:hypothetical protein
MVGAQQSEDLVGLQSWGLVGPRGGEPGTAEIQRAYTKLESHGIAFVTF